MNPTTHRTGPPGVAFHGCLCALAGATATHDVPSAISPVQPSDVVSECASGNVYNGAECGQINVTDRVRVIQVAGRMRMPTGATSGDILGSCRIRG
jgi:hypothetical protein